jgi:dTDP-4-amino-4,6-dideoxygalactose transaminase
MRGTFLPYCRPCTGDAEASAAADALRNGWLTAGPQTAAFEEAFARASGVSHAVALNSCTAGLHLAMAALGIGPGDDVVMPSLTFAAGAQCAIELGARPVFCDVDAETLSASVATIAAALTPATKAIVAMPYAGRPHGARDLAAFANERGIPLIEDAAHAAGMLDGGAWAGRWSTAAVYSFYATKNLTTGEGGMLLTNDPQLADRVRRLSLHGMSRDAWRRYGASGSWRYDILEPGYKYNFTDIAASVGLVQLGRLAGMQARRDEIARRYLCELGGVRGLSFARPASARGDRHAWCMFPLLVGPAASVGRDELVERLRERNVGTSVHYIPTHRFTAYRGLERGPLPNTEAAADRILSLPLYPSMSDEDVDDVVSAVVGVLDEADLNRVNGRLRASVNV